MLFDNSFAQIAQVNHHYLVAKSIRHQLNIIDDHLNPKKEKSDNFEFISVHLGAPEKPVTLSSIELANEKYPVFHRFRLRLAQYLNAIVPQQSWPNGQHIKLQPHDKVCYPLCVHCQQLVPGTIILSDH